MQAALGIAQFIPALGRTRYVDVLVWVIPVIVEFLGDDFLCFRVTPFCVAEVFGSNGVALVASSMELAESHGILRVPGFGIVYECNE